MVNLAFELAFEDNFVVRYHKDLVSNTTRNLHFVCLLSAVGLPSSFDALGNILLRAYSETCPYYADTAHTLATCYVLRQLHSCHVVSWECGVARLRESNRQV